MKTVCVIGLGTVGMPTANYIADSGLRVYGYDIIPKQSEKFYSSTTWSEIPHDEIDVYVICVWSKLKENGKPDPSSVVNACKKLSGTTSLICIESTVPVGTCRYVASKFSLTHVAHCPHRYWKEEAVHHGVKQCRVLGAIDEGTLKIAKKFYFETLAIPVHVVSTIEIAELCKIAENAYRFVQIAFAEELKIICDSLKINFNKVREACNTKWNTEILEARDGIKGECLPKDTKYLLDMARDENYDASLLRGSIIADQIYQQKLKRLLKLIVNK